MTSTPVPDAAVQIVWKTLADFLGPDRYRAEQAVTALAAAGWLHDPARLPALRAVAKAVRRVHDQWPADRRPDAADIALGRALAVLDAVPAAETTSEGESEACDMSPTGAHEGAGQPEPINEKPPASTIRQMVRRTFPFMPTEPDPAAHAWWGGDVMTEPPLDAAVEITEDVIAHRGVIHGTAGQVITALAAHGWLDDPARRAARQADHDAVVAERDALAERVVALEHAGRALLAGIAARDSHKVHEVEALRAHLRATIDGGATS